MPETFEPFELIQQASEPTFAQLDRIGVPHRIAADRAVRDVLSEQA